MPQQLPNEIKYIFIFKGKKYKNNNLLLFCTFFIQNVLFCLLLCYFFILFYSSFFHMHSKTFTQIEIIHKKNKYEIIKNDDIEK